MYYKVLDFDGSPCHGGSGKWHRRGKWMPAIKGEIVSCLSGYHLCRRSDLVDWLGPAIWEARFRGEVIEKKNKIVVSEARLVRRLDTWNGRTARLFACDCAERVVHLTNNDPRCSDAIVVARAFAMGEATEGDLTAARDATMDAWEAAWGASLGATKAAKDAVRATGIITRYPAVSWDVNWDTARAARYAAGYAAKAAWEAAEDAEREWQTVKLLEYLEAT